MKSTIPLPRKLMHLFERLITSMLIAAWSIGVLGITPHAVLAQSQNSKKPEEEIKDLVVMITCQTREQKIEGSGAGIIFGADKQSFYIATAAHVAFPWVQEGRDLYIQFNWQERK